LADDASTGQKLREVTSRVMDRLSEIDFAGIGLQSYLNFRNQSEQAKMLDPAWT
jgi:hypothetical protein